VVAPVTPARVYLDANVFIAAYENQGARSDHAWWLLDAIERGDLRGVTSEITLAELLVRPFEEQDHDLIRSYQEVLSPADGMEVPNVTRQVLIEAAILRSMRRSLRLPDAIHVASARLATCSHLVSDDRRLTFAPGVELVQLGPHALTHIRMTRR
jgi:predicted nucleic acid-binding protein